MATPVPLQHNVVATTSSGGTPNTAAAAYGSNNAAGSLLIAAIGINLAAASISGIVDTRGNTWAKAVAQTATAMDGEVWYAPNSKAGANTLTITMTGSTLARVTTVNLVEVSNILLVLPIDKTGSQATASTSPVSGSTALTTKAVEFLFGVVFRGALVGPTAGPTDASAPGVGPWNSLDEVHSQNPAVISAYFVSSAVGQFGVGWTTANANYVGIIATFLSADFAGIPKKPRVRPRLVAPVKKLQINRRIHEEPSLGSMVLFAPVRRPEVQAKRPMPVVRKRKRIRRVIAGAALLFAPVRRPRKAAVAAARAIPVRPRARRGRMKEAVFNLLTFFARVPKRLGHGQRHFAARASGTAARASARRFRGALFDLASFFARVPRRNRQLPKRYILHAAPPLKQPRRRPSLAAAASLFFVAIPKRRGAHLAARLRGPSRPHPIDFFRRILGGLIPSAPAKPDIFFNVEISAIAEFDSEVVQLFVPNASVLAVAEFSAEVR